jgi:hypothetical protein
MTSRRPPDAQGEGGTAMTPPPVDRDGGDASRNPDGRITRDVVLAAAPELIDRDGVDGLSMRRLARVLRRDPMILYRYAPNKAAGVSGTGGLIAVLVLVGRTWCFTHAGTTPTSFQLPGRRRRAQSCGADLPCKSR